MLRKTYSQIKQHPEKFLLNILENSEFCFSELTKSINKAFNENKFHDTLKLSDIVPVFKKLDPTDKTNFRPVSLLPLLSNVHICELTGLSECHPYFRKLTHNENVV